MSFHWLSSYLRGVAGGGGGGGGGWRGNCPPPPFSRKSRKTRDGCTQFLTPYFTKSRVIVLRVSKDCPNEVVFLLKKTFSYFKRTRTLAKPDRIFRDTHAPVKCRRGKGEAGSRATSSACFILLQFIPGVSNCMILPSVF